MGRERKNLSPTYTELIIPTYDALKQLGGSGTNNEIYERVIVNLNLSDEVLDEPHLGSLNQSEVEYQLAWARTYLKNYGIIVNSARSVWSITSEYASELTVSAKEIVAFTVQKNAKKEKWQRVMISRMVKWISRKMILIRMMMWNFQMRLSRGDSSWQMYYRIWIRMDLNDYHNDYYVSVDSHKYLLQKNQEMEELTELES